MAGADRRDCSIYDASEAQNGPQEFASRSVYPTCSVIMLSAIFSMIWLARSEPSPTGYTSCDEDHKLCLEKLIESRLSPKILDAI